MKYIAAILFSFVSSVAFAQEELIAPPFGFQWQQSYEAILKRDPSAAVEIDGALRFITISRSQFPELPSNTDYAFLIFLEGFGLVKVSWSSKNFESDPFGTEGKESYETLSKALSQKLGDGESVHISGSELYTEADEFYECLNYSGCGMWATRWLGTNNPASVSVLQLKGLSRGEGYISYTAEHPEFTALVNSTKSEDASKF